MKTYIHLISTMFLLIGHLNLLAQKVHDIEIGDSLDFNYFASNNFTNSKGRILQFPRLKDSLPDGTYKVFDYPIGNKKKKFKRLYIEVTYHNGVKDGQEFFYGYFHDKRNHPVLSSITLTEYKNGKLDGLLIMCDVNAENTFTITKMQTFINDSANGISIDAPSGLIRQVLYYENNEIKDTIWTANKSINDIYYKMINNTFHKNDYLFQLLKKNVIKSKAKKESN